MVTGMSIQLSQDQRMALKAGTPVRVRDDELADAVVVCPAALFDEMQEQLREVVEDEKEQAAWVRQSTRCFFKRLQEEADD
jgi:hypothetical protein